MKRVLVYGMTDNLGGLETFMLSYISNIDNDKVVFDFIAPYEKISIEEEINELGGTVYHLPKRKENIRAYMNEFKVFMKNNASKYDAVWLNDCMFCNLDILILAKIYGIKTRIIHAHNSKAMGSKSQLIRHTINKRLIGFLATDFWACSKLAGEWSYPTSIAKKYGINVVTNAIDTEKYNYKVDIRNELRNKLGVENAFVIGNVGRLHFQKNQDFMLDIFKNVLSKKPNAVLWLIGGGEDEEKLRTKVNALNIDNNVVFWGIRRDVPDMLQAMDVFLMPSKFEGLGIVAIEAQSTGLPCIMSDVIPKDTNVTEHAEYLSLDDSPSVWAEKILCYSEYNRHDSSNSVKAHGFDIKEASRKLENQFINIINNNLTR